MILLNMDAAYAFLVHPGSMARVSASGVGSWRIMIAARYALEFPRGTQLRDSHRTL